MRINSVCSCLILCIQLSSWLNECLSPANVFCLEIRKFVSFQYFKVIVQDVVATALRFMINFSYLAFAFNRISLIGKEHNKLTKFFSDIELKKYIGVCLVISVGFSIIKYFSVEINFGDPNYSYPSSTDLESFISLEQRSDFNVAFYVINFISDIANYVLFFFIHFSIDVGMLVRLRRTLNEKLDKSKAYSTKEKLEKKKSENEAALHNAISMVIVNTSLGVLLKIPSSFYSVTYLIIRTCLKDSNYSEYYKALGRFFYACTILRICEMSVALFDFLYLLSISVSLFVYRHFDKKFL